MGAGGRRAGEAYSLTQTHRWVRVSRVSTEVPGRPEPANPGAAMGRTTTWVTVWAGSSPRPGEDPPAPSPAWMQVGLVLESQATLCPWNLGAARDGLWASVSAPARPHPFLSCSEPPCLLAAPSHPTVHPAQASTPHWSPPDLPSLPSGAPGPSLLCSRAPSPPGAPGPQPSLDAGGGGAGSTRQVNAGLGTACLGRA